MFKILGIFFHDQRMAHVFSKYPEVLFFDATHSLNSRKMPLFIQSCMDGNGETEIVSLFICKAESREGIGAMIDVFKECNSSWDQTKVIIGDKDFADRDIYAEKFQNAELQICLFHVMCAFNREITPVKRNITRQERIKALEIMQRIVYSPTEEAYDSRYNELMQLMLRVILTTIGTT